jgi:hypothetical protein
VTYSLLGTAGTADYRIQIKVSKVPLITFIPYLAGNYQAPPIVATAPAPSLGAAN